jgi:hypothetical protein
LIVEWITGRDWDGNIPMSWKTFEETSPQLARISFERLNRKIAYLATVRKDGSPRLHPVTPFIGNGMLFIFTELSSPKIRDLKIDPRYAMHCAVGSEGPLIEVEICGKAMAISDPHRREQAKRIANSPVVSEKYVLFEFNIHRVLIVEYDK